MQGCILILFGLWVMRSLFTKLVLLFMCTSLGASGRSSSRQLVRGRGPSWAAYLYVGEWMIERDTSIVTPFENEVTR